MKIILFGLYVVAAASMVASDCPATVVGDQSWADEVHEHSAAIQNYGAIVMDETTAWWLTGPPDADDYHDYAAGWRSTTPEEYVIMRWDSPLDDRPGDDLTIRLYGGPAASAEVLASIDGQTYVSVGEIGGGVSSEFRSETFDFDGLLGDGIAYVKVQRIASGPQTGMFFDAFGSVVLSPLIPGDANDDKVVDQLDLQSLAQHWGRGTATWEMGDFNGDDAVNAADAALLAANWGHGAEEGASAVPEPSAGVLFAAAALLCCWPRRSGSRR